MPITFEVTAPDGRKFRITRPDDGAPTPSGGSSLLQQMLGSARRVTSGALTQQVNPLNVTNAPKQLRDIGHPELLFGGLGTAAGTASGIPGGTALGAGAGTAFGRALSLSQESVGRQRAVQGGVGPGLEAVGISSQQSGGFPPGAGTDIALSGGTAALLGSLGRGGFKTARAVGATRQGPLVNIARRIRASFVEKTKEAGALFDEALGQVPLTRRLSLENVFRSIKQQQTASPKFASDITAGMRRAKSPLFKRLLDAPEQAADLTVREAQEIKNVISKIPSLATKRGKFGAQFTDTDLDLLEVVNDIRGEMVGAAPEMTKVNAAFGQAKEGFKLLKPKFKEGSLLGNIGKNFGDPETMSRVKAFLPQETIQDIKLLKRGLDTRRLTGRAVGEVARIGAIGVLARMLFGGRGGGGGGGFQQ